MWTCDVSSHKRKTRKNSEIGHMLEPSNHFCMFPSLGVAVTTVESVLDGRSF